MKQRQTYLTLGVKSSVGLFLVKCYDNKIVELPISSIISPLSGPQVAKQQQQKRMCATYFMKGAWISLVLLITDMGGKIYTRKCAFVCVLSCARDCSFVD